MINPGTRPIDDASEDVAAANLTVFLDAVRVRARELEQVPIRRRIAGLDGDPVRNPGADRDGRFGWDLPVSDGSTVLLLMPGVALPLLREDHSAMAPCLWVAGQAWWWPDAVGAVASVGMIPDS